MRALILLLLVFSTARSNAQTIPVEVLVGHERTRVDMLWFKPFKPEKPWLFFNRNTVSIDHGNRTSFNSIAAVSYNLKSGIGFVANATFNSGGFFPKAGVQLFKKKNHFTLFGWAVSEVLKDPDFDVFVLARYEPPLTGKVKLFTQLELFTVFNAEGHVLSAQRLRLGISWNHWQIGPGGDFTTAATDSPFTTRNIGGFLRREF